jgi:hypothetical protein
MPQYVAILPDGTEFFGENNEKNQFFKATGLENICEQAVRKAKLTTPRKEPKPVKVELLRLEINEGKLVRVPVGTYNIIPSKERMTDEEYETELSEMLETIPEAFRKFVRTKAYDDGHSSGLEECLNIAESLVSDLIPCIREYTKQR